MEIINRIFFRFHQFYSKIEEDEVMVFYFSAFAFSFLLAFYFLLLIALFYLITDIKLIEISGFNLTILFFAVIGVSLFFCFKNKSSVLKSIQDMPSKFRFEDVIVGLFVIMGITSLFVGGMILY